ALISASPTTRWRRSRPRSGYERAPLHPRRDGFLRPRSRAQGRRPGSQCRRDRGVDRRQWRRQIDPDDDGVRQSAGARGPHRVRWPRHHPPADPRDRPAQARPGAGGPPDLSAHDGSGKPADGRDHGRAGAIRGRSAARDDVVPAAATAAHPARRHVVGRRAADARHRAGTDEPAAPAVARRAVARPRAADRAADLRRHPKAQQRRRIERVPGRAERLPCAQARAPRLCHSQRPDHAVGHRPRIARPPRSQIRLPRGRPPASAMTEQPGILHTIAALLYEDESLGIFVLITVVLGGGAALLAGRAIAATWRPWWQVVIYTLILGGAVRFIHFALFGGTLLSPHYYAVDCAICLVAGLLGFRAARVAQMVRQYRWINVADGPLRWRRKPQ